MWNVILSERDFLAAAKKTITLPTFANTHSFGLNIETTFCSLEETRLREEEEYSVHDNIPSCEFWDLFFQ